MVSIIRSKYEGGRFGMPKIDMAKKGSNFWNGLDQNWKIKFLNENIGNGEFIFFWHDKWVPGCVPFELQQYNKV